MSIHLPINREFPFSQNAITSRAFIVILVALTSLVSTEGRTRRTLSAGQRAVVVDERLAALRDKPNSSAPLLKRLSRGRKVTLLGAKRGPDGLVFYRVAVTRRTRGWLQKESVVSPAQKEDDERLLNLISASKEFDRIARASIFLDLFPHSHLRPAVLLLFGDAAEDAARRLSKDASRRLDEGEMRASGAPLFSYFMNYNGLDRYRRQGIVFVFDPATKEYHYDGACWREVVRRYPRSNESLEARRRLADLQRLSFQPALAGDSIKPGA
jgi:hypothetical protein